MSASTKSAARRNPASGNLELVLLGLFLLIVVIAYASLWLGNWLVDANVAVSANPFEALITAATGTTPWPVASTVVAVVLAVLCTALALAGAMILGRRHRSDRSIDRAARSMAAPKQLREVSGRSARTKAVRLRPDLADTDPDRNRIRRLFTEPAPRLAATDIGIPLGPTVRGGHEIYMSWEDVLVCYAGTRMGKTAAVAIPAICAAPGPVPITSNKRDIHDHTRGLREQVGTVWLYDLQNIAGGEHSGDGFFWNPLRDISTISEAKTLAAHFADASKADGSRVDSYFDGGAQALLALHILAAALNDGDLLHVYGWLSDEACELPKKLLELSGQHLSAMRVETAQGLNPRQRDGLYDMARRFLEVLEDDYYARTVTPNRRTRFDIAGYEDTDIGNLVLTHELPEFVVADFATSTDTLYALSMEGPASATALTTALMGMVLDAAVQTARTSPRGRVPVPMVAILDEAANVCKLRDLPQWYSHFGSQGICLITILQSPAQAGEVWGQAKVAQMSEAANFVYYGGGLKQKDYLDQLSALVDNHDVSRWSTSRSGIGLLASGSSSTSQSWSREAILSVGDLAQMEKDRALLIMSGNPPMLIRKAFWSESRWAADIEASAARYGIADEHTTIDKTAEHRTHEIAAGDTPSGDAVIL